MLVPRVTVHGAPDGPITFGPPASSTDDWMTGALLLQVSDAVGGLSFDVKLMETSKRIPLTADDFVTAEDLEVEVRAKQNQQGNE